MRKNNNTKQYWDELWTKAPPYSSKCSKFIHNIIDEEYSILDIGCGNGRLLKSIGKTKKSNIFGIDLSPIAIDMLNKDGISGMVMDIENFTFTTPYDIVILSHTLEHITNDEELISKIALITKKYLIVAVPNDCMEEEPQHVRIYNKESLTLLLSKYFIDIEYFKTGIHLILKCYVNN